MSEAVIRTHQLTKRYGEVEAVRGASFEVRAPGVTGFLGRNGAGKSTTIKMLLGMVKPSSGTGTILGHSIADPKDSILLRRRVAYVGEDKGLYAYMTVAELIRFTRSFYDDWRPDVERRLLRDYQLPEDRKVKALSKGMRTKLALLLALSRRPDLLILDEPTEGLDPVSVEELLQMLAGRTADGTTVFFSSHQLSEVERIADDILLIDKGRLLQDISLDELRENYRRVTLGFDVQPREEEFRMPGVARIHTQGRQMSVLTSCNTDALVERARGLGAVSVDVAPASLREVFLEIVQGTRVMIWYKMLWYKAWRESRMRFGIMALALGWACGVVILMQQGMRAHADEPTTYVTFIWKAVYKGAVRDMFAILVMMLGLGGLVQERAVGTAGFTLALPVSRGRLVATRAAVGFLELALLAFLPAILLPLLSPFVGESYPVTQGLQFALLWAGGGAILFAATFFLSALLAGEYTAWVLCIAALTVYSVVIHVPPLANFPELDFLSIMSGAEMPYFRSADSRLIGPMPWPALLVMALAAFVFVWGADEATRRRDFS